MSENPEERTIFGQAKTLDIVRLNPILNNERLGIVFNRRVRRAGRLGLFAGILRFLLSFLKQLLLFPGRAKGERIRAEVLFFSTTRNQERALAPVFEKTGDSVFLKEPLLRFPLFPIYLYSVPFFFSTLSHFFRAGGYVRDSFRVFFDEYWCTYGYYIVYRMFLLKNPVRVVVLANDHSIACTTLAKAARDAGVRTVYIQHASVTEAFPPLEFDYALLEGYDALRKYDKPGGPGTRAFLVGMPRYDAYIRNVNRSSRVGKLGICTNALDPPDRVEKLVEEIRNAFPDMPVFFRPHPSTSGPGWKEMCRSRRIEHSDPLAETSFDFFGKIDAVIAGNSNILLEAALADVYPMFYEFSEIPDYYGFHRNGLVDGKHTSPGEVIESLRKLQNEKPSIRVRAKRYCDTLDTEFEGKSSEIAAEFISQVAAGDIDMSRWRKITDVEYLEAYRLNRTTG